ncbi:acyltransferase [Leptothoe sp. LEGE 181152]|nr:acyltransferase [Leptothoe sp. LEGE 181152]
MNMPISKRVEVIDVLRGLAAMAVVLFHFTGYLSLSKTPMSFWSQGIVNITEYGYVGVPIFFVLSGYVIALTASRYRFSFNTGVRFTLRRLVRLTPPYWCMVSLFALTIVTGRMFGFFQNTTVTVAQVVAHLVYAQDILEYTPLDIVHWTLCLEAQFYIVFSLSNIIIHRYFQKREVLYFSATVVASILINTFEVLPNAWFPCLWYQFGLGILIYYARCNQKLAIILFTLASAMAGLDFYRGEIIGVTVLATSFILFSMERFPFIPNSYPKCLSSLGQISYSLYLVHGFVGLGLGIVFKSLSLQSEMIAWFLILIAVTLSIAFSVLFNLVCEQPAASWSRQIKIAAVMKHSEAPVEGHVSCRTSINLSE